MNRETLIKEINKIKSNYTKDSKIEILKINSNNGPKLQKGQILIVLNVDDAGMIHCTDNIKKHIINGRIDSYKLV